jgi:hypothetical protein
MEASEMRVIDDVRSLTAIVATAELSKKEKSKKKKPRRMGF